MYSCYSESKASICYQFIAQLFIQLPNFFSCLWPQTLPTSTLKPWQWTHFLKHKFQGFLGCLFFWRIKFTLLNFITLPWQGDYLSNLISFQTKPAYLCSHCSLAKLLQLLSLYKYESSKGKCWQILLFPCFSFCNATFMKTSLQSGFCKHTNYIKGYRSPGSNDIYPIIFKEMKNKTDSLKINYLLINNHIVLIYLMKTPRGMWNNYETSESHSP